MQQYHHAKFVQTVYNELPTRYGLTKRVGHFAAVSAAVLDKRIGNRQAEFTTVVVHHVLKVRTVGNGYIVFEPRGAHRNCT